MDPICPAEFALMVFWINEREAIRKAKEAGLEKPWSTEPLFQNYRWCNVSRMDDRVSVDLMRHWYSDADWRTQLVAAALGRLVNWPESLLEATGGRPFRIGDLPKMRAALHARAARGVKVWTGAYVIPGVPGEEKIESIMDLIERIDSARDAILQPTLRQSWEVLIEQRGIAGFLAGQIGADLAQLSSGRVWPDRFTWAPVGPGSKKGMNRLRGRPITKTIPQDQFDRELLDYMETVIPKIGNIAADRKLCAQDFQSTCCEFSKYRKLSLNEGRVRARYDGGAPPGTRSQQDLFA